MVLKAANEADGQNTPAKDIGPRNTPFMVTMTGVRPETSDDGLQSVILTDEDEKDLVVQAENVDDHLYLVWKTKEYEISDIVRVMLYDLATDEATDEATDGAMGEATDSEVELEVDELDDSSYVYSDYLKTDDILSSLIRIQRAYGHETQIRTAHEASRILMELAADPVVSYDERVFQSPLSLESLPSYLVPIHVKPCDDPLGVKLLLEMEYESPNLRLQDKLSLSIQHQTPVETFRNPTHYAGVSVIEHEGALKLGRTHDGISASLVRCPAGSIDLLSLLSVPMGDSILDQCSDTNRSLTVRIRRNLERSEQIRSGSLFQTIRTSTAAATPEQSESVLTDYLRWPLETFVESFSKISESLPTREQVASHLLNDPTKPRELWNLHNIRETLSLYQISYGSFNHETRKKFREILKRNIQRARKASPFTSIKVVPLAPIEVPPHTKLVLALKYIMGIADEYEKKRYLQQIIQKTQEPTTESHRHWLYSPHTRQPLLCLHYKYYANSTNENSLFDTMVSLYGTPPKDGVITCRNCGHALCNETETDIEGYEDGHIVTSKRVMTDSAQETYAKDVAEFISTRSDEVEFMRTLGSALFLELPDDLIYEIFRNQPFWLNKAQDIASIARMRYGVQVNEKGHLPRIVKALVECKGKKKKKGSEKVKGPNETVATKKQQIKVIEDDYRKFINETHYILTNVSMLLVYIQTAVPSLGTRQASRLRFIDPEKSFGPDALVGSNKFTYVLRALKKISERPTNPSHSIWNSYGAWYREDRDDVSLEQQLRNVVSFTLEFPLVEKRWQSYMEFRKADLNLYLRPEWPTFKPLVQNSLSQSVKRVLEKDRDTPLLQSYRGDTVENISLIRTIRTSNETNVAILCKIPTLPILQNQAFLQLFRYAVSCYGVHTKDPTKPKFELLIRDLLRSSQLSEKARKVMELPANHKMLLSDTIQFHTLRKTIIPQILAAYDETSTDLVSCYSDGHACNRFVHMNINNYDSPLLNISRTPKRYYDYTPPTIFPDTSFKDYLRCETEKEQAHTTEQETLAKRDRTTYTSPLKVLFQKYRTVNGVLTPHYRDNTLDSYLIHLVGPTPMEISVDSHYKALAMDQDTFSEILRHRQQTTRLPYHPRGYPSIEDGKGAKNDDELDQGERRLIGWLVPLARTLPPERVTEDDETDDETEDRMLPQGLVDVLRHRYQTEEFRTRAVAGAFNKLFEQTREELAYIAQRFSGAMGAEPIFDDAHRALLGKTIPKASYTTEGFHEILQRWIENPQFESEDTTESLSAVVLDIERILVQISGDAKQRKYHLSRQDYPVKATQRRWKVSLATVSQLTSFTNRASLTSHRNCYDGLLHRDIFVNITYTKRSGFQQYERDTEGSYDVFHRLLTHLRPYLRLTTLRGIVGSRYNLHHSEVLSRAVVIRILNEVLSFQDTCNPEEATLIQRLLADLLIHLWMTRYDPLWLDMNLRDEMLQSRVSKRKEREKQELLSIKDSMSAEERYLAHLKEEAGLSSDYKELADKKKEFIESAEYAQMTSEEQYEMFALIDAEDAIGVPPDPPNQNVTDGYDNADGLDDDEDPENYDGSGFANDVE